MRRIYLDANATTPLMPEVLEAMRPFLLEQFGNASSIHQEGQRARAAVEQARQSVTKLVGCQPAEVVFTSGGTEGDNLAIFGSVKAGDHVITSAVEHHAVLHTVERLRGRGVDSDFLPVDEQGVLSPEDVRRAIRPNTRLITVMAANNETGVKQPIEEIGKIAAENGTRFHVDAVQAVGKMKLDVNAMGCHLLTISGHKMHAPQGTGALFVRRGTRLEPLFSGGAHERQRRAGTENVAGIVGLGKAADCAVEGLQSGIPQGIEGLRDRLERGVLERVAECGINGAGAARVANTTNLWFSGVEGEALVIGLDLKGVAVSTGSACSSGVTEPSHVLEAMGLTPERAKSSVRFSLHRGTTEAEIEETIALVASQVSRMREHSKTAVH